VRIPGQQWVDRARQSPLVRRLAVGAFWSIGGTIVSRAISLLSSIATARYLGKSGFGEFGAVVNTMGLFLAAASLGLGMTAMKYVAELRCGDPERAARIVRLTSWASWGTGALASAALAAAAPWLASAALGAPALTKPLRASAVGLLLSSVIGAQSGALAGFGAFRAMALANVLGAVVGLPIIVLGAARWGVIGAVWGTTVGLAATCLIAGIALQRLASGLAPGRSRTPSRAEWGLFWRFSVPAFLSSALVPLVTWITAAMLVNQPDGYGEMGIWNAANQWFTALLFLPTALAQVVLPALSERLGAGDRTRATQLLGAATAVNAGLPLVPAAAGIAASPLIMGLYGQGFRAGWPALAVSVGAAALVAVQTPWAQIIEASGRMWLRFSVNVGWALTSLLLTWGLLARGALGLTIARLIAYLAIGAVLLVLAVAETRRPPPVGPG